MALLQKYVLLNNGSKMPILGLGTWQSKANNEDVQNAIKTALEEGYRHIDTAYGYQNEASIGQVLQKVFEKGKIKREDLFIVSKLPGNAHRREKVKYFLKQTLDDLQTNYVDLYLIHSPVSTLGTHDKDFFAKDSKTGKLLIDFEADLLDTWKGMEDVMDEGMTKSIGLSNFNSRQIQHIYDNSRIKPANLQVECHAYLPQQSLLEFCKKLGISFTAYAPLGSPSHKTSGDVKLPVLLDEPKLSEICKRYDKTPAQILLRWLIQRGMIVIPKSITPARIKENSQVFDFTLSPEDINTINDMNKNLRYFTFESIDGIKDSPEYPFHIPF